MRRLLQEYRTLADITQAELAQRVGETQSYVSKVERGERRLDLVQLQFFCRALGLGLGDFVDSFEERIGKSPSGSTSRKSGAEKAATNKSDKPGKRG